MNVPLCSDHVVSLHCCFYTEHRGVGCPGHTQPVGLCRDIADFKGILRILCKMHILILKKKKTDCGKIMEERRGRL